MRESITRRLLLAAVLCVAVAAGRIPAQEARAFSGRADVVMEGASAPNRPHAPAASRRSEGWGPAPMAALTSLPSDFVSTFDGLQETRRTREAVRLVPAGEPLADAGAAVGFIRGHCEQWGVAAAALAKALDVRPSVIQTLLESPATIPDGPRHTLLRDAEAWCRADAHARELRRGRYVPTSVTRLVAGVARMVRATHTIGLTVGAPGLGKSHALAAIQAELPGSVVAVRSDPDSRGARGLLHAIGLAAGGGAGGAVCATVKAGIQAARQSNGLLVIDEAQLLSASALEAARAVFDGADVGLLLIGTTALQRAVDVRSDPLCGPLVARIALRCDLDAELLRGGIGGQPRPWLDAATLRASVARHVAGELDADACAKLLDVANFDPSHLRRAVNAAKIAAVLAGRGQGGGDTIRGQDVETALRMGGKGGAG